MFKTLTVNHWDLWEDLFKTELPARLRSSRFQSKASATEVVERLEIPGTEPEKIGIEVDEATRTVCITVPTFFETPICRTFSHEYDLTKLSADYKFGVLTLRIPTVDLTKNSKTRKVKVEIGK